ncbi:MAG: hypothetical protein JXB14_04045 [Candidatus Altiarchaeota archaeon]|nr:hypothetical protein [Candidatus Altiarchaeota archaeon]
MGEWGKWWSSRGRDQVIKCEFCGRNVPKHKAVEVTVGTRLSRDVYEVAEYVSMSSKKGYCCISCAKHRRIVRDGVHTTEKEKRIRERAREKKEMDKIMAKVSEIERKEKADSKKAEKPPVEQASTK